MKDGVARIGGHIVPPANVMRRQTMSNSCNTRYRWDPQRGKKRKHICQVAFRVTRVDC